MNNPNHLTQSAPKSGQKRLDRTGLSSTLLPTPSVTSLQQHPSLVWSETEYWPSQRELSKKTFTIKILVLGLYFGICLYYCMLLVHSLLVYTDSNVGKVKLGELEHSVAVGTRPLPAKLTDE